MAEKKKETKPKESPKSSDKKTKSKKVKTNAPEALVYVWATFNNTIVTFTDLDGNVLASSSPGMVGFKGTKKSTAFAATKAAEDAALKALKCGVKEVKIYLKGPGQGRNAAVKGIDSAGIRVTLLSDLTPIPHNGCRPRRPPRN
ncbi:30S ribosomal protein S11 [Candidatus Dojkabacteria bacterium]|nr:30S ribosomal protein S11 [Candidatus Dojkabacteria bacterium]